MTVTQSRTKATLLMTFLVFAGVVIGFFLGLIVAGGVAKRKENPEFWKQSVHKQLDKLKPTPEQRQKLEARTDSAVQELATIKVDTIKKVWTIVEATLADLDKELTPEQRVTFDKLKPKKPAEVK